MTNGKTAEITVDMRSGFSAVFSQSDEAASIAQNIALLLRTKKGTVPMYREFGIPMEFLDKPPDIAENLAVQEAAEAVEEFEPRAKLEELTAENGKLTVIVSLRD